jgi:hypothetical protein
MRNHINLDAFKKDVAKLGEDDCSYSTFIHANSAIDEFKGEGKTFVTTQQLALRIGQRAIHLIAHTSVSTSLTSGREGRHKDDLSIVPR